MHLINLLYELWFARLIETREKKQNKTKQISLRKFFKKCLLQIAILVAEYLVTSKSKEILPFFVRFAHYKQPSLTS